MIGLERARTDSFRRLILPVESDRHSLINPYHSSIRLFNQFSYGDIQTTQKIAGCINRNEIWRLPCLYRSASMLIDNLQNTIH